MTGVLYIVATPIGNLEDVTLRALRVLGEVGVIAAEDTRTTRKLLNRYGMKAKLVSYHGYSKEGKTALLLKALETQDVALVSEAGMPGINDPGYELVVEAIKVGVAVVPIPGPSATTASLAVSGLPAERFVHLGFLPRRKGERRRTLASVRDQPYTMVAFEAPHRIRACLEDILAVLGDRQVAVCRELTKLYEEVFRGTVSEALDRFSDPRGEFTLVLAGATEAKPIWDAGWAAAELARLKSQGLKAKEAVSTVVQASGLPRRDVYGLWVSIGRP